MAAADPLPPTSPDVARLLRGAQSGDISALDQLLPLLYSELHAIAARHMSGERADHTLQPTALVHEAFLRLASDGASIPVDRTHFLRTASRVMRRVLVDHARSRQAAKRGPGMQVTLDEAIVGERNDPIDMLALDAALDRLAAADPRWGEVVELRFFAGLSVEETAAALGTSPATVKRDWQFAKGWLARELGADRESR